MKKNNILLTSNVLSKELNFFVYIKTNADNKLNYNYKKNIDIDLVKINKLECYIWFQRCCDPKSRVLLQYSMPNFENINQNILEII